MQNGLQWLPRGWPARVLVLIAIAMALTALPPRALGEQALDAPALVVALDKLDGDKLYARTVMLASPSENGGHFGLILNRPTPYTMSRVFPDHPPSAAVQDHIYLGGPAHPKIIFALARSVESPGAGSEQIVPGVWLIIKADAIDAFIERSPNEARYFLGIVRWRPGELNKEIRAGEVMLRPFDAGRLFMPDTSKMYEELVPPNRKPALQI